MTPPGALLAQIYKRCVVPLPDCLLWANAVDRGYGRIWIDGTARRVHRVVWELEHGPIPEGLTVDHLCRVRSCVNTEHMELVTASENSRRATSYRPRNPASTLTHCKRGHEFTPENTVVRPDNRRRCRQCDRERKRRQPAA